LSIRINQQAAYVLHARPWSETSLLVDVFTREHGRFRLLAKGARRQKTGQRALLQPFQPLIISWTGRRSLGTLTGVELRQMTPRLRHRSLASAYYMSELLFKFLHAHDAHEILFEAYEGAIEKLLNAEAEESVLRGFECSLLSEIGYGMQLKHDASSLRPVEADARYYYFPEKGPIKVGANEPQEGFTVSGSTLQALENGSFNSQEVQQESKQLLRMLLTRQIRGRVFNTRKVYAQILKTQAQ
jgi:DNA repair protein RecO (recombination protein O)